MLTLDTNALSETDLEKAIVRHLSPFGRPTVVKVMPRERQRSYDVVAVKMATRAEAQYAAARLGHSQYGPIVIIRLAQRGMTAPLPFQSRLVH